MLLSVSAQMMAQITDIYLLPKNVEVNLRNGRTVDEVRKDFLNAPVVKEFLKLSRLEQMKWLAREMKLVPGVDAQISWTETLWSSRADLVRSRLATAKTYKDFVANKPVTDTHCRVVNIEAMMDSFARLVLMDKANRDDAIHKAFYTEHAPRLAAYGTEHRDALAGAVAVGEAEVTKVSQVYVPCKSGCSHSSDWVQSHEAMHRVRVELGIAKGASKPSMPVIINRPSYIAPGGAPVDGE
jgi:hypothetical protein